MTARETYRGWDISFDYPPIPLRDFDWSATHPDYDGEGDDRCVHGRTRADVCAEVDSWINDAAEYAADAAREDGWLETMK